MTPRNEHEAIAARCVELAMSLGATGAEATVVDGDEFEVQVRLGEIETLKEAGSRAAGVRLLYGRRAGSAYTSDLSEEGLRKMVRSAAELAKISTEDPHLGLPDPSELGALEGDLALWDDRVTALDAQFKIEQARLCERAALDFDPRISNSEGAGFGTYSGWRSFANSHGFLGSFRSTSCSLSVVPVVKSGESLERDWWASSARAYAKLESPEYVGRRAAERVLRRLGARKAATQKVPVVFEPRVARSLVGHIFAAVNGDAVWRKASFLAESLGRKVASSCVTVIDDSTLAGLAGTAPFDAEGAPARRTVVIEDGVLASWLLNCYTARKLGMKTTGNAARGVAGNPGTGHGNLYMAPGGQTPEQIIAGMKNGLYVTELLGSGVNIVNGDYSRGAAGLWIENGELAWPVQEITIAGNLREMLERIEAVGSDLEFRGSVACPTLLIGEMTVSGQ